MLLEPGYLPFAQMKKRHCTVTIAYDWFYIVPTYLKILKVEMVSQRNSVVYFLEYIVTKWKLKRNYKVYKSKN